MNYQYLCDNPSCESESEELKHFGKYGGEPLPKGWTKTGKFHFCSLKCRFEYDFRLQSSGG